MEQTLYSQYVQKYFPALVTEIVERLNEKRGGLTYLYRDLLAPTYSNDGRWASVLADYTRVAADVVALDSELPLKSRDSLQTAQGDIPKMGMKLYLTEKQMKDIDAMIAQNQPTGRIVERIFADTPRCIEGIYERIEDVFLSELSTGVGISERNNGTGVRIDVGYYEANQFDTTTPWSNTASAPLDDIQKAVDKATADGNVITDVWMDDTALRAFYNNPQVRGQFAFINGITPIIASEATVPVLNFAQAAQIVLAQWGMTLHRVARKVKTEIDGSKGAHTPWQQGKVVFTCDQVLGSLVWTDVAEVTRPAKQVDYQTADEFILVSKYSTNDPLREFTSSQAMVIPITNNLDRIYTIDTTKG